VDSPDNAPAMTLRTDEQRRALLTRFIAQEVARGGRVELHTDFDAVVAYGKKPNHILHLLLSLLTLGTWLIIWLILAISMNISRVNFHVDEYGWIRRVPREFISSAP